MRPSSAVVVSLLLAAVGCEGILGLDDFKPRVGLDAGAGTGGSGGDGGAPPAPRDGPETGPLASGGAVGVANTDGSDAAVRSVPCSVASACPVAKNGCQIPTCEAGFCGIESLKGPADCVGGSQCDGQGNCVDCLKNGVKDNGETDIDCGGTLCGPCNDELECRADDDCISRDCEVSPTDSRVKICFPGACNDHRLNGGETDVDCGGECQPCGQGSKCGAETDCTSRFCVDGICCGVRCAGPCRTCSAGTGACHLAAPNSDPGDRCPGLTNVCNATGQCSGCTNGRQDSGSGDVTETDVDCGGTVCGKCAVDKKCRIAGDCASDLCDTGKCAAPRCSNNVRDGAEADTDCGTICGSTCGVGATCFTKLDCASGSCVSGRCLP